MPVTSPVTDPTVPATILLLLHVPPPEASVKLVVNPIHTVLVPFIVPGNGLTVTVVVAIHPVGKV